MLHHVLAILALLAVYVLIVLVKPDRACPCTGRCSRCKGTGRRFWPGARILRAGLVIVWGHARERRASRNGGGS